MRVSFVLRVDSGPLAQGQLVGEIEEVSTGRVGGVRSAEDLMVFFAAGASEPAAAAAGDPGIEPEGSL